MSEVGETESSIAAEQEGIAYMSEFPACFHTLHAFEFFRIEESVGYSFVLDGIVPEWVSIGSQVPGRNGFVD